MFLLFVVCLCVGYSTADTPANCTYEDIEGSWLFYETERSFGNTIDCSNIGPVVNKVKVDLLKPNTAVDEYGNIGKWTIIYNQGFEVTVNQRVYFAFSKYDTRYSYCNLTENGWSHDVTVRNWACYKGIKLKSYQPKQHTSSVQVKDLSGIYRRDNDFIARINQAQSSWRAKAYDIFEGKTHQDILLMHGGRKSRVYSRPGPAPLTWKTLRQLRNRAVPEQFDWRNVSGINYVPPVRNQGSCGSCYAFASVEMVEARIRIMTKNSYKPILSPKDVVDCSTYSQGCQGGFPYLVAGKYGQDFGMVLEQCDPYNIISLKNNISQAGCTHKICRRHYTARYRYIGDYYGACNEELMKLSLVRWGPVAVGMEVYNDFMNYESGIYRHTFLKSSINPFELTNHAVLVVGYGFDKKTGEKYWIVQNSWGTGWGEKGFFRIRRGTDECAIESLAVEVLPIP